MSAAALPFGTIIANGPRVWVKLSGQLGNPWCEAMTPSHASRPQTDSETDWLLDNGWAVVRHGLGETA